MTGGAGSAIQMTPRTSDGLKLSPFTFSATGSAAIIDGNAVTWSWLAHDTIGRSRPVKNIDLFGLMAWVGYNSAMLPEADWE